MPVIIKRLDARYDWIMAHWGQRSYQLKDAGDGCSPSPSLGGAVAWVSEGNCSFFTKVRERHMSVNVTLILKKSDYVSVTSEVSFNRFARASTFLYLLPGAEHGQVRRLRCPRLCPPW